MSNGFPGSKAWAVALAAAALFASGAAVAAEGQPVPWQLGLQPAASPIAAQIDQFHDFLLYIITAITLFVLGLLIYVMVRFNERANPEPSKLTHNTGLEVAWTLIPVIILIVIAIPSFRLLFDQYTFPKADVTIKAIGNQWYWTYEYPDADDMTFDSLMVEDADLKPGQPRLLTVDNEVVVPVNKNVHVLVTATDVLHNWAMPAFGVKLDAVPGRVLKTWFRAEKTGMFYGQCSELCGVRHAFMPIAVRVVSESEYQAWLETAKKQFASKPRVPTPDADPDGQAERISVARN